MIPFVVKNMYVCMFIYIYSGMYTFIPEKVWKMIQYITVLIKVIFEFQDYMGFKQFGYLDFLLVYK